MAALIDRFLQRPGTSPSPEDLEDLAALAAQERQRLAELLELAEEKIALLSDQSTAVDTLGERISSVRAEQDKLQERMAAAEDLASLLSALESRTRQIENLVRESQGRMEAVTEKTDAVAKASEIMDELSATSREAERRIAEYREQAREIATVDDKVEGLFERMDHFETLATSIADDYQRLQRTADGLRSDLARLQEGGAAVGRDLEAAKTVAAGIEDMLSGLTAARNMARQSEEQLHKLNALSEHVNRKVQALSATQHALERAEVQSRKVNELVWGVEQRMRKVTEEARVVQASRDRADELSRLHHDLTERVEETARRRREVMEESRELQERIEAAVERLEERLAQSRNLSEEIDLAGERVRELGGTLARQQEHLDRLGRSDQEVTEARKNAELLLGRMGELDRLVVSLEARSTSLGTVAERLDDLDALSARVEARVEAVAAQRDLVTQVETRLTELSSVYQETRNRLETLEEGRGEIQEAVEFLEGFRRTRAAAEETVREVIERLDRVDAIHGRVVEVQRLAGELETHLGELEPRVEFVEAVEARLNRLDELSRSVDARSQAQLARQGELEAMELSQQGLKTELADLKKLAASLLESDELRQMEVRLADVEGRIGSAETVLRRTEGLEDRLARGETGAGTLDERLAALTSRLDRQEELLRSVEREAGRARELRSSWETEIGELKRQEGAVRERADGLSADLEKLEAFQDGLAERWRALEASELTIGRHEEKLLRLESSLEELDRKTDRVNARHTLVERIKREVDGIYDTCEDTRRSAAEVMGARKTIGEARTQMERLTTHAADLEGKLTRLQEKLAAMETTEYRVDALANILDDLTVNLETFGEQKAIVDHLADKLGQVEMEIRRADATVHSLREERRLADRIQEGIRALRAAKPAPVRPVPVAEDGEPAGGGDGASGNETVILGGDGAGGAEDAGAGAGDGDATVIGFVTDDGGGETTEEDRAALAERLLGEGPIEA